MEMYGMTGEPLGKIGVPEQKKAEDGEESLPQWKRDFLEKPSISVRKGIAWGFQPPYEDADVLVLTAPSSKFVDIRFPILDESFVGSVQGHSAFWAFSGVATTTFPRSRERYEWPLAAHCVWEHDIDSRGSGVTDEGDMFLLKNGDAMEVGVMKDPSSGKLEMYKEYWTEPQTPGGREGETKKHCVVAETVEDDGGSLRGRIIRVGNHCQGIIRITNGQRAEVLVGRWTREEDSGKWRADLRNEMTGSVTEQAGSRFPSLPCAWLCSEDRTSGDETVTGGGDEVEGVRWRISEMSR